MHLLRAALITSVNTFCASQDTWVSYGWCPLIYRDIFAQFKTTCMWRKENLASALMVSKKEIGGNHAFFRDTVIKLCTLLFFFF